MPPRWSLLVLTLALGCAGEAPRVPVTGRVTFHGYPVPGGVIAFTPDRERGQSGPAGHARLAPDGSFQLPDGGLPPGWYRVTIASLDVSLPSRYRDPDLANLSREIKSAGGNRVDVMLDD